MEESKIQNAYNLEDSLELRAFNKTPSPVHRNEAESNATP